MKYKLVTMHQLIENSRYLELLKDFKIEKKVEKINGFKHSVHFIDVYFIEIESIHELENLQEVTGCAICIYKGTLEIQDNDFLKKLERF